MVINFIDGWPEDIFDTVEMTVYFSKAGIHFGLLFVKALGNDVQDIFGHFAYHLGDYSVYNLFNIGFGCWPVHIGHTSTVACKNWPAQGQNSLFNQKLIRFHNTSDRIKH